MIGIILIAVKLADHFRSLKEPPTGDYPSNPTTRKAQADQPLRPFDLRPTAGSPTKTATNATSATAAGKLRSPAPVATQPQVPRAGAEIPPSAPAAQSARLATGEVPIVPGVPGLRVGGLAGRVLLRGAPPPEKEIQMDPACGTLHPALKPATRFFVVSTNGGLADVFVVLTRTAAWEPLAPPRALVEIRQRGCEYFPYVTAAQVGQTVRVFNDDPLLHNVHPTPTVDGNHESNRAQLPRALPLDFTFTSPEPFLRFKCDVHPWMFAYVNVVEHPFFAVTDAEGKFALPEPPPGDYAVRLMHRKAGTKLVPMKVESGRVPELTVTFDLNNREANDPPLPIQ
jgi:plastocyanin